MMCLLNEMMGFVIVLLLFVMRIFFELLGCSSIRFVLGLVCFGWKILG